MDYYIYKSENDLYTMIRNHVISLELQPGEMFSESSMASKLNASRVTVREAITQLYDEGYIEVFPQKGTCVTQIDIKKIKQAVYAHTVLEQEIIEEIMERGITEVELEMLKKVLEEQKIAEKQRDVLHLVLTEYQIMYQLSVFCEKEFIWDFFQKMDSDLLRVQYLQNYTYNYQGQMSSGASIEHSLLENRLQVDNFIRGDKGAAILNCVNRHARVMWQAEMMKGIYPQYFTG